MYIYLLYIFFVCLYFCLFVVVVVIVVVAVIFLFFSIYLSLVIALLLLLLQLCLLILLLWVFLRNQMGESSKQGIQVAWYTPIYHVKWWISRFRGAFRTHAASEVVLLGRCMSQRDRYWVLWQSYMCFVILSLLLLLLILLLLSLLLSLLLLISDIIFITFIIIRLLGFLIKNSLVFLWGKLKAFFCFLQFLHVS